MQVSCSGKKRWKDITNSQNNDHLTDILLYISHFKGRLAVSVQPLRIGRCSQFDAFYGYLDFVSKKSDHFSLICREFRNISTQINISYSLTF